MTTLRARNRSRFDATRRHFLVNTSAIGGGLALGWHAPLLAQSPAAAAALAGPELNVWVLVQADERCVIRIARSEMGQGTLTGLAQLVAEELECDWSKVSTEQISPQRNFAAKRAWGCGRPDATRHLADLVESMGPAPIGMQPANFKPAYAR